MKPKDDLIATSEGHETGKPADRPICGQIPLPRIIENGHDYGILNKAQLFYVSSRIIVQRLDEHKAIYCVTLPAGGLYYFRSAEQTTLDVIVKRYSAQLSREFEHECDALLLLHKLKDPRITTCLARYCVGEEHYLMLPMAKGTLAEYWTDTDPQLQFEQHKAWLLSEIPGLMTTLSHMHAIHLGPSASGLMHGDIQPGNILVTHANTLAFTDFELSAWPSRPAPYKSTRSFEAPEAELSSERETESSDIWSMGCVILECLIWLFQGAGAVDTFKRARVMGIPGYSRAWKDDFFFLLRYKDGEISEVGVKGQVVRCADELRADERCRGKLRVLLDLVMSGMIVVNQRQRKTAKEIAEELNRTLME